MAKAKTIYEDELECECGGAMKPKLFNVEGFDVRGWQCLKCHRIDYSDDMNVVLTIKKFKKKGALLKLRKVGETVVITIPKEIREALELKEGGDVTLYPVSKKKVVIEIES
ncbi:MAG: AbrB/MazE/SpoVT family DNA-binding domain-containing protein [Candidatus Aenigmarchaeota archaeon]|nr:AbrB/MazE/SpoVT family DNA-binding domain-containing protein [Candidatus Aenigmarchaeota archaeon]